MTASYGSLLAVVIPVIMLALLLEMRTILDALHRERVRIRSRESSAKESEQVIEEAPDIEIPGWLIGRKHIKSSSGSALKYGRLGTLPLGWPIMYGITLLLLGRSEFVSLAAANGKSVSSLETYAANVIILTGLAFLTIVPVGLEIYVRFGGSEWPNRLWVIYNVAGFIALLVFVLTTGPYL